MQAGACDTILILFYSSLFRRVGLVLCFAIALSLSTLLVGAQTDDSSNEFSFLVYFCCIFLTMHIVKPYLTYTTALPYV